MQVTPVLKPVTKAAGSCITLAPNERPGSDLAAAIWVPSAKRTYQPLEVVPLSITAPVGFTRNKSPRYGPHDIVCRIKPDPFLPGSIGTAPVPNLWKVGISHEEQLIAGTGVEYHRQSDMAVHTADIVVSERHVVSIGGYREPSAFVHRVHIQGHGGLGLGNTSQEPQCIAYGRGSIDSTANFGDPHVSLRLRTGRRYRPRLYARKGRPQSIAIWLKRSDRSLS